MTDCFSASFCSCRCAEVKIHFLSSPLAESSISFSNSNSSPLIEELKRKSDSDASFVLTELFCRLSCFVVCSPFLVQHRCANAVWSVGELFLWRPLPHSTRNARMTCVFGPHLVSSRAALLIVLLPWSQSAKLSSKIARMTFPEFQFRPLRDASSLRFLSSCF